MCHINYVINMMLTLISPPPGICLILSLDPTFDLARSLKSNLTDSIFLSPPFGLWDVLSNDPIFDLAFQANFCCGIYNCKNDCRIKVRCVNLFVAYIYFSVGR